MAMTDWDGPDYARLSGDAPYDKDPEEYSYVERRSEIYGMIEDAGHPKNLERNQTELANRYGVAQSQISKDMAKLREYEAHHNGTRTRAVTSWLAEKTVTKHIQAAKNLENADRFEDAADRFERAMAAQLEYADYLFESGDLERAPDELHVSGDAGEAYMAMLREASEKMKEEER